jgi:hypothetical protein
VPAWQDWQRNNIKIDLHECDLGLICYLLGLVLTWCTLEFIEHGTFLSVFWALGLEFVHCGCEESAIVVLFGLDGLEVGRR